MPDILLALVSKLKPITGHHCDTSYFWLEIYECSSGIIFHKKILLDTGLANLRIGDLGGKIYLTGGHNEKR